MRQLSVFGIIIDNKQVLATTRPEDKKHPFGLPGGKVDPGETAHEALLRECKEEGVDISRCVSDFIHVSTVGKGDVIWFLVRGDYQILDDYKEKYRGIKPVFKTVEEISNSGYGNEFIKDLNFEG